MLKSEQFIRSLAPTVRNGEQQYTSHCSMIVRGGERCRGKRLTYVSPKRVLVCLRHQRLYQEAEAELRDRQSKDHANGFHGEGEDRKAFAEAHDIQDGYFRLICQECVDDIAGEELGVGPDQVDTAKFITSRMKQAQLDMDRTLERFNEVYNVNPCDAITNWGERVVASCRKHGLYSRVIARSQNNSINIVDAYNSVCDELKDLLVRNRYSDSDEREAVSEFIRGW